VRARYEAQRSVWLNYLRTNTDAQEEANRSLERHVALQRALRTLGHLPADAAIDGVYGPTTRAAIASWQRAEGVNASGFLSNFQANLLEQRVSARGR
jgi:peptidoglycan hydrolase-like protein with peptidoglycan-binding domain